MNYEFWVLSCRLSTASANTINLEPTTINDKQLLNFKIKQNEH